MTILASVLLDDFESYFVIELVLRAILDPDSLTPLKDNTLNLRKPKHRRPQQPHQPVPSGRESADGTQNTWPQGRSGSVSSAPL